jgi:hypothetical protein
MFARLGLFVAFAAALVAMHLPYLRLPFHWDELGQFVPAALDLYRDGAWVTTSTEPNIHPPGLMALLAAVWSMTGFSILSSRLTMLLISAAGLYFSFLLAIRLARGTRGAPAFAAVACLAVAPMFYTQSMMVLLDMPAMMLTIGALLLFLDERYAWCALVSTLLVLVKETALTTPMVFGAWLLFRERRMQQALYFFAPAIALALWLVYLQRVTGSWFGNAEFARYNVDESFTLLHVLYAMMRRVYTLFLADGHWIGSIALWFGWRLLRGRDWTIALWVAGAQIAAVSLFGGAVLDRYLLPVLPILYAAFAVAASALAPRRGVVALVGLLSLLVVGWFVNPPFPFPLENNLAVVDFVDMQKQGAEFIESRFPFARVASVWPFSAAVRDPDFGYVEVRIPTLRAAGLRLEDLRTLPLTDRDLVVTYSRGQTPPSYLLDNPTLRAWFGRFLDLHPEADAGELRTLGYHSVARWERHGQWLQVYAR